MNCVEQMIEELRQRGERVTIQRRQVIEVLCAYQGHQTVQDIQARLAGQGMALSEPTIYRIVQWLKDLGVVCQTDLGRRGIVYQVIGEHPHHHLICLCCGQIIDVDDSLIAPLRDRISSEYAFAPRIDHMAIFGLCADCQAAQDAPDA
jgi:Fur family ferric uptake transcriptional regulator